MGGYSSQIGLRPLDNLLPPLDTVRCHTLSTHFPDCEKPTELIVTVTADLIQRPQDQGEIQKGRQGDQDEIQPDQGLDREDQEDG